MYRARKELGHRSRRFNSFDLDCPDKDFLDGLRTTFGNVVVVNTLEDTDLMDGDESGDGLSD